MKWTLVIVLLLGIVPARAQDDDILWQDTFDDEDPTASLDVGWFYYDERDGLSGSFVGQEDGVLKMVAGNFGGIIGAVVAGTNGVPQIILDENLDPTPDTEEAIKANDYSSPNQVLTFKVNFLKITQSFFLTSTRMVIDDDSLDSDPTESPGYALFISPLQGIIGLAKYPGVEYAMLDPTSEAWTYFAQGASSFELDVWYWIKIYLNEGEMKLKFWEGEPIDEPRSWTLEGVDQEPRVGGQFTYFALLNGEGDEIRIDDVTMRAVAGTAVQRDAGIEAPRSFVLRQNYPNPFNPATEIQFDLARSGEIHLTVHNSAGQQVAVLAGGYHAAGTYRAQWDASAMPSGVYFCRLQAADDSRVIKMVLMK